MDGASEGTFFFDARTLTPKAQPFADYLNTLSGCGAGGFQVDVATDVLTAGCPPFGVYPKSLCAADYDLVKVDATTLQFGMRPADNDMCTPEKRPTTLNPEVLHKQ